MRDAGVKRKSRVKQLTIGTLDRCIHGGHHCLLCGCQARAIAFCRAGGNIPDDVKGCATGFGVLHQTISNAIQKLLRLK